jgi:hypothetical protein
VVQEEKARQRKVLLARRGRPSTQLTQYAAGDSGLMAEDTLKGPTLLGGSKV